MSIEKTSVVTFEGRSVVNTRELLKQDKVKAALLQISKYTSGSGSSLRLKKTRILRQQKPDAL